MRRNYAAGTQDALGTGATQPTGLWSADSRGWSGWATTESFTDTLSRFIASLSDVVSGCSQHSLCCNLLRKRSITCWWLELRSTTVKQQREDLQAAPAGFAEGEGDNHMQKKGRGAKKVNTNSNCDLYLNSISEHVMDTRALFHVEQLNHTRIRSYDSQYLSVRV